MARKKGERGSRKSLKQQYDFLKVKGAEVVLDFNHDPSKQANSVILRYGTGNTSDHSDGYVRGGFVYWLDKSTGVWTQARWSDEASMGAGNLLGLALGNFAQYEGTPETVGMLIQGVATTAIFGQANIGAPIWGSYNAAGRMAAAPPYLDGTNIFQKLGHSLGWRFGAGGYVETIVSFTPSLEYAPGPLVSNPSGSSTDNAIVRFHGTGGKAIQNSGCTIDDTNNMTVPGDVTLNEYIYHNGDADTFIRFAPDLVNLVAGGYSAIKYEKSTGKIIINNTNEDVDFHVMAEDNTELLTTDAANNRVGIGTTAPEAYLDIKNIVNDGATNRTMLRLHNYRDDDADVNDFGPISIDFEIENVPTHSSKSGIARIAAVSAPIGTNHTIPAGEKSSALIFSTMNDNTLAEAMRINASGNIGIGTNDPIATIDVRGDYATGWAGSFYNDGNNANRYGVQIICGEDDNTSGTGYLMGFFDGDSTNLAYITFSGGTVAYGTFTGEHYSELQGNTEDYAFGTILKIVSCPPTNNKTVDYVCAQTTEAKDPAVLGVYNSNMKDAPDEVLRAKHTVWAVGDGYILVCSEGGDISTGDYVCSSNTAGHGMKQDDDLMHNYTVAKASEPVTWSEEPSTQKLIACTYHCG